MDDFYFLTLVVGFAPIMAVESHPCPFQMVVAGAIAACVLAWNTIGSRIRRRSEGCAFLVLISLFLAVIWTGSLLVMFTLKLPGWIPPD